MVTITTKHILSRLLWVITQESNRPEFAKTVWVNTNYASFQGSDGSSSIMIHINLTISGDEIDPIVNLQSDLGILLIDKLIYLFNEHLNEVYPP